MKRGSALRRAKAREAKFPFLCCLLILFFHKFSYNDPSNRLDLLLSSGIHDMSQSATTIGSVCLNGNPQD